MERAEFLKKVHGQRILANAHIQYLNKVEQLAKTEINDVELAEQLVALEQEYGI